MTKTCMNPSCQKTFTPGHYGEKQLVCSGGSDIQCGKCYGSGKQDGKACGKCHGRKKVHQSCKQWYKDFWSKTRRTPREIPPNELKKILKAVEGDPRYHALLVVASESAMRKGELLGLTWADVLDGAKVRNAVALRGQWDDDAGFKATKTGEGRTAYLFERSRAALGRLRRGNGRTKPADRVWPYNEVYVWKRFTDLQKTLKIANADTKRPFRFHDLRHHAAIQAYKSTGDIQNATVLCGHRNPATTQVYLTVRPEEFVAKLDSAFKKKRT